MGFNNRINTIIRWTLFFALVLFSFIFLLVFPPGVWITLILLLIWGALFLQKSLSSTQRQEILEQTLGEFQSLFPKTVHGSVTLTRDPADLCVYIKDEFKRLSDEKAKLEAQLIDLQRRATEYAQLHQSLDSLCPVHISIDITSRWNTLIEEEWAEVNKQALESLNAIKSMNDQNQVFIAEVIKEFGEHQETFLSFSQLYKRAMVEYTRQAESAKKNILDELDYSSKKIEETFGQFSQVEDITEKIKMISLNLSIQASKVRGAESFSFLARELRRLAQSSEEITMGISLAIKETLASMKKSREDEIKGLSTMDTILMEFERILAEYDATSGKLSMYMQKAIERIDKNQVEQKAILLKFFKELQQIAIVKEEMGHQIQFYGMILNLTNEYVQKALRSDKKCQGASCPQLRYLLEELAKVANTDKERRMVNSLFKELLGEDREEDHGTLARDVNDFVSFN